MTRNNHMLAAALAVAFLIAAWGPPASASSRRGRGGSDNETQFSRTECRWAVKWINNDLTLFMAKKIVKKIVDKKTAFEVYVDTSWNDLSFSQKGQFLQNMSRAREITGHDPFFSVFYGETRQVVARVHERAIEILVPPEGFFLYLPVYGRPRNTTY